MSQINSRGALKTRLTEMTRSSEMACAVDWAAMSYLQTLMTLLFAVAWDGFESFKLSEVRLLGAAWLLALRAVASPLSPQAQAAAPEVLANRRQGGRSAAPKDAGSAQANDQRL